MTEDSDKPSIAELQDADLTCRCGGEFSRGHNETRGCPRHGHLPHHVVARERALDAAPVLLEIAQAAKEWHATMGAPRGDRRADVAERELLAALTKVRR